MTVQLVVTLTLGNCFMFFPKLAINFFAKQEYILDSSAEINLDMWRLLGGTLMFISIQEYLFLRCNDEKMKREMTVGFILFGIIMSSTNTWVQLRGYWNPIRWSVPVVEWLFTISHIVVFLLSPKLNNKKKE